MQGLSKAALDALLAFAWPGNIRQLERDGSLRARLDRVERGIIAETLIRHDGNVRSAALALGVGRTTLYRRLQALDIEPA